MVKAPNTPLGKAAAGGAKGNALSQENSAQGGGGGVLFEPLDRSVIYYKLTSSDVILLGGIGILATLFFSASSACFSFYMNLRITLAFAAQPLLPEAQLYKDTFEPLSFWVGLVCLGLALIFAVMSVFRFNSIKKEHTPTGANSGKL